MNSNDHLLKKIRFSVIIPLFNKGGHIASTITSVLNQIYTDFEIIVVDDGSTDDSFKRAQAIATEKIRIIQQKNNGVSSARNTGIREATGEYVAFLDADDYWYPWHLQELNLLIENNPGCGVYSVAHEIFRNNRVYLPKIPFSEDFKGKVENIFSAFSASLSLVNSTTACLSREILINLDGFPESINKGEDIYVWIKASLDKGLAYSSKVSASYNKDADCRSNSNINHEVPFYIIWLDNLIFENRFSVDYIKGAQNFLRKGVLYNAAGLLLERDYQAVRKIRELNISQEYPLKALLLVMSLTPVPILKIAQRYRHSAG